MTNFEKITILLISFLIIVVLAFGAVLFSQQKAIRNIESELVLNKITSGPVSKTGDKTSENTALKSKALIPGKKFGGEITGISGNELSVRATLIDYSKPKNPEKTDFELMEKTMKVSVNADTKFFGKKLTDLKTGDIVNISAKESASHQDSVTAEIVSIVKAE